MGCHVEVRAIIGNTVRLMRLAIRCGTQSAVLSAVIVWVACTPSGSDVSIRLPVTAVDTVGDTIVARTRGEVRPEYHRRLLPEWRRGPANSLAAFDERTMFADISDIAIGLGDRIYVWDGRTPGLMLFSETGEFVKRIGRRGSGPGEYGNVNGIAVLSDGRLVLWDGTNSRLNVYTPGGELFTTWRPPVMNFGTVGALSADDSARVWLRAPLRDAAAPGGIGRFALIGIDTTGVAIDTLIPPVTGDRPLIARGAHGMSSYDLPYGRSTISAVARSGALVWGPSDPYALHARWGRHPLLIEREWTPVALSERERAEARKGVEGGLRLTDPSWTWQGREVPSTKPAYQSIRIGLDDRIWVLLAAAGESELAETDSARSGKPRLPDQLWDVFEANGRYLGRVRVAANVRVFAMRGDTVWGVIRDPVDDVPVLARLRVTPGF
jgi:hypothetical protein